MPLTLKKLAENVWEVIPDEKSTASSRDTECKAWQGVWERLHPQSARMVIEAPKSIIIGVSMFNTSPFDIAERIFFTVEQLVANGKIYSSYYGSDSTVKNIVILLDDIGLCKQNTRISLIAEAAVTKSTALLEAKKSRELVIREQIRINAAFLGAQEQCERVESIVNQTYRGWESQYGLTVQYQRASKLYLKTTEPIADFYNPIQRNYFLDANSNCAALETQITALDAKIGSDSKLVQTAIGKLADQYIESHLQKKLIPLAAQLAAEESKSSDLKAAKTEFQQFLFTETNLRFVSAYCHADSAKYIIAESAFATKLFVQLFEQKIPAKEIVYCCDNSSHGIGQMFNVVRLGLPFPISVINITTENIIALRPADAPSQISSKKPKPGGDHNPKEARDRSKIHEGQKASSNSDASSSKEGDSVNLTAEQKHTISPLSLASPRMVTASAAASHSAAESSLVAAVSSLKSADHAPKKQGEKKDRAEAVQLGQSASPSLVVRTQPTSILTSVAVSPSATGLLHAAASTDHKSSDSAPKKKKEEGEKKRDSVVDLTTEPKRATVSPLSLVPSPSMSMLASLEAASCSGEAKEKRAKPDKMRVSHQSTAVRELLKIQLCMLQAIYTMHSASKLDDETAMALMKASFGADVFTASSAIPPSAFFNQNVFHQLPPLNAIVAHHPVALSTGETPAAASPSPPVAESHT